MMCIDPRRLGALAVAWVITHDGLVLLVLLVSIGRSVMRSEKPQDDRGALALFVFVAVALAIVFRVTQARTT